MTRGLILQGGGFRGAFAAGACLALAERDLTGFDLALAVSASVPTLAYFLSGQRAEMREVWENYVATRKLVRYSGLLFGGRKTAWPRPLLDTHHLVFEVFRDRFPLDLDKFRAAPTEAYFVALDAQTNQAHYFPKDSQDIYQVIWACLTLPAAVPEQPLVSGRSFLDGGIVDPIPVGKALALGAEKILAVLTVPLGRSSRPLGGLARFLTRAYFRENPGLWDLARNRHQLCRQASARLEDLRRRNPDKVVILAPEAELPAGRVTRNRSKVLATMDLGRRAVEEKREAIARLLAREA